MAEFPFGHHVHHHRRRNDDDDEPPPPYPPPPSNYPPYGFAYPPPSEFTGPYGGGVDYPPHTYAQHEGHVSYHHQAPPPPQSQSAVDGEGEGENPHHFRPHVPTFIESHIHHEYNHHSSSNSNDNLASKPSVRVYCKADANHSLAIRDGQVILARSDPNDPSQHWVKDEKYSTKVKDKDGFPCFALVNKATGQAIKHSIAATQPVQLLPYNPDKLDLSVLWTTSNDLGEGYKTIRMVNDTKLTLDAFHGDKYHEGVHDGTTIVVWEWAKGDNQAWKIVRY